LELKTASYKAVPEEPGFKSPLGKSQLTTYHATNRTELDPTRRP